MGTSRVSFSVLQRTETGFLGVGVWYRFIGFWVNSVGFSTSLFFDVNKFRVLQFPQGVDRLLPPTVEQGYHLADGIIEVNPPVFVRPSVFSGQLRPPQDKGIQYFGLVGQGLVSERFKQEIGKPGEALCFHWLMEIDKLCHRILWTVRSPFSGVEVQTYYPPRERYLQSLTIRGFAGFYLSTLNLLFRSLLAFCRL